MEDLIEVKNMELTENRYILPQKHAKGRFQARCDRTEIGTTFKQGIYQRK